MADGSVAGWTASAIPPTLATLCVGVGVFVRVGVGVMVGVFVAVDVGLNFVRDDGLTVMRRARGATKQTGCPRVFHDEPHYRLSAGGGFDFWGRNYAAGPGVHRRLRIAVADQQRDQDAGQRQQSHNDESVLERVQ